MLPVERLGFFVILFHLLAFAALAEFLFVNARQRGLADAVLLFGYALGLLGFVLRGFYDVWPLLLLLHAFQAGARGRPGAEHHVAANAPERAEPQPAQQPQDAPPPAAREKLPSPAEQEKPKRRPKLDWATLQARTFGEDVWKCARCGAWWVW